MRVGLVGCVKSKSAGPREAGDLYVSTLFSGRRAYVQRSCDRWFVLSAKHGVVEPRAMLEPYDETLTTKGRAERRAWSSMVLRQLTEALGPLGDHCYEIHAGAAYCDFGLRDGLYAAGATVTEPAAGMRIGEQLAFYKR